MNWGQWLIVALLASGCVSPLRALKVDEPLQFGTARIVIKSDGSNPDDVRRVRLAVGKAQGPLQRWGGLAEPVAVYVVNSHDDLETAVHRPGFGWLRAWGRFDEIVFQAPSTWSKRDEPVDQLVLHELTHCLLFQRAADRKTWLEKDIPLWFREGMAIVTAQQDGQYPSLEDTARWISQNPTLDPFRDGEALSQEHSVEVYGVGLHAFRLLEDRVGEARLIELMARMRAGATFATAFASAVGLTVEQFQREFEEFLKLRRFRDLHRELPKAPAPTQSPAS